MAAKLYFDQQSGLLMRFMRFANSPLGVNPSQMDYTDYRDVDGVQIPFRMTISEPEISSTIQFSEVQQNVPIDAAKFAKPHLTNLTKREELASKLALVWPRDLPMRNTG